MKSPGRPRFALAQIPVAERQAIVEAYDACVAAFGPPKHADVAIASNASDDNSGEFTRSRFGVWALMSLNRHHGLEDDDGAGVLQFSESAMRKKRTNTVVHEYMHLKYSELPRSGRLEMLEVIARAYGNGVRPVDVIAATDDGQKRRKEDGKLLRYYARAGVYPDADNVKAVKEQIFYIDLPSTDFPNPALENVDELIAYYADRSFQKDPPRASEAVNTFLRDRLKTFQVHNQGQEPLKQKAFDALRTWSSGETLPDSSSHY